MDAVGLTLVLSLSAGVAGTGIGGALGALFADKGERVTSSVLSFAAGVMLGISLLEMLPETMECFSGLGRWMGSATFGALMAGAAVTGILSALIGRLKVRHIGSNALATIAALDRGEDKGRMFKAGLIMLIAIALHNFPEGMAIGGAGSHETAMGVSVAIAIAVHNIPEGMAISAPLAGGGMRAWKAVALSCLAGSATVLGAIVGLLIGAIGGSAAGACLGISAGAMTYVAAGELLKEATAPYGKLPWLSLLAGIMCAAAFTYLF